MVRLSISAAAVVVVASAASMRHSRPPVAHAPVLDARARAQAGCDADDAGLTLPPGFCAGVYASGIASARHMAVASNGDLFVISNPGGRGRGGTPVLRGVWRLRDTNRDGKADLIQRVADVTGSGIAIANNALYAEAVGQTTSIVRFAFKPRSTDLVGTMDTIVQGIPRNGNHTSREFVIRGANLYLNVGSATNACQTQDRQPHVPGVDPCTELETRAGTWEFSATTKNQVFSPAQRFATGIRNGVSLTLNPRDNELYVVQHGRDQLADWGMGSEYGSENPAEALFHVTKGKDYGWPYCYYSTEEKRNVTAPEYGGDGKKDDRCRGKEPTVYAFPGHWGPNGALFYTGAQFPAAYRDGIFVAFHGSWNRTPKQQGYNVTFLPMANGKATGPHVIFADSFSPEWAQTPSKSPPAGNISHRPSGLAQGIDGSMFVSDDAAGYIYRIVFAGK